MRVLALLVPLSIVACIDGVTTTPLPIYEASQPPVFDATPEDARKDQEHDAMADVEADAGHDAPTETAAKDGAADGADAD
jgi:hypothetical protein